MTLSYQRLAANLQNYERFLSTSHTQDSVIIRRLLGDPQSAIYTVTQALTVKYSHQVSTLLTAYRLLDLEMLHNGPEHPISVPPLYPNLITYHMVSVQKVKDRWKKLENWQVVLIEFRDCYHRTCLSLQGEDLPINEPPRRGFLAHLQGLADSHSNQQFGSVVQNFRGAALHWTFLHEMAHPDKSILPTIPEAISAIIDEGILSQLNERYPPHIRAKMDYYLQQHTQGELVLPLHLSLLLTPCFLLMLTTLVKSKFPRHMIYQVSIP